MFCASHPKRYAQKYIYSESSFFLITTSIETCVCASRSICSLHVSCMIFCSSSWWSSLCWISSLVSSLTRLLTWEVRSREKKRSSRPHVSSAVRLVVQQSVVLKHICAFTCDWEFIFGSFSCPRTGLERDKFDNKTVTFEEHIKEEHNLWHYLFFIVLVRVKDSTEYTGPESYVAQMIKVRASMVTTVYLSWGFYEKTFRYFCVQSDTNQAEAHCP